MAAGEQFVYDGAVGWSRSVRLPVVITVPSNDTDQTAYIAAQLAAVGDGASAAVRQVVQIRNADPVAGSRVDGSITFSNRHHLIVQAPPGEQFYVWTDKTGQQAGIVDGAGESLRYHVRCQSGTTDVTIKGFKVEGPNLERNGNYAGYTATRENEHAFAVTGATTADVTYEDCEYLNVYGDACSSGTSGAGATNTVFRNIVGSYSGRHGISITTGEVTAEDCQFNWCGRAWNDIETNSSTSVVPSITLRRCSGSSNLYFISQTEGAPDADGPDMVGDLVFEDLTQLAQSSSAREMFHCNGGAQSIVIRGCTSTKMASAPRCINVQATFGSVLIEDNDLSCSGNGVDAGGGVAAGQYTVQNNDFNNCAALAGGTRGTPDTHSGNTWNNGASSD